MFTRHLTHCGVRSCITPALADARDSHGKACGVSGVIVYLLYPLYRTLLSFRCTQELCFIPKRAILNNISLPKSFLILLHC
jgi:hypothetical protein